MGKDKKSSDRKRHRRHGSSSSEEGEFHSQKAREKGGDGESRPAKVRVQDKDGEVSMSVDETNKLRLSLGLAPLKTEKNDDEKRKVDKARQEKRRREEKRKKAEDLKGKIKESRERRRRDAALLNVKGLGEVDGGVEDDVEEWVKKSRHKSRKDSQPSHRRGRKRDKEESSGSDSDEGDGMGADELGNFKVKHNVDEIQEGETVIMTLADQSILDDKGRLNEADDELENVLKMEDKKRKKAYEAAKPKTVFDDEKSLLAKYDEEEEDAMQLDQFVAQAESDKQKREEQIRERLQQALTPSTVSNPDYYTPEEVVKMRKPKRKKKKLRKKAGDGVLDIVKELEVEAGQKGKEEWAKDHSSRKDRIQRVGQAVEEEKRRAAEKAERFNQALDKANIASSNLRNVPKDAEMDVDVPEPVEDLEADELYDALNRARRVSKQAQSSTQKFDLMAEDAARRRKELDEKTKQDLQKQEEKQKEERHRDRKGDQMLVFTDTSEFCRTIELGDDEKEKKKEKKPAIVDKMEEPKVDVEKVEKVESPEQPASPVEPETKEEEKSSRWGNWVPADGEGDADKMDVDQQPAKRNNGRNYRSKKVEQMDADKEEVAVLRENPLGQGIAAALGTLRDKGDLKQNFEWVGRTNDMKKGKLLGIDDVYKALPETDDDRLDQSIKAALTRKDELGRILTPKEAFRELSYAFHGKGPSKNTIEKRDRKTKEEYLARRANLNQETQLEQLKEVQKVQKSAFVVLSGKGKMGAKVEGGQALNRDPSKKNSTKGSGSSSKGVTALTPVLGGGATPLTGNKKVEVMLGIKKKGAESMPPPHPRKPKAN